jgi:hypothetical protein
MYTVTAWEEGNLVWESLYDSKPTHYQIMDDMLREGVHADEWDYISMEREYDA